MTTRFAVALIITFTATFNSYAHESDRIDMLEQELIETQKKLLDTRKRLAILESMIRDRGVQQKPAEPGSADDEKMDSGQSGSGEVTDSEGWKSRAKWQELSTGMSMGLVRKILGDPQRQKGASVATWYYENGGSVVFWDGYLKKWSEPN